MAILGTMVENVRRNLQEISPNAGNQSLYSSDNIRYAIGVSYKKYSLVMMQEGEGYFEATANLGLTGGVATVSLAGLTPTYFKLSVLRKNTPTGRFPLRSSEKRFTPIDTNGQSSSNYTEFKYRFIGRTTISLDPVPAGTEAATDTTGLQVEYIYLPTFPLATSLDTFEFDSNFSPIFDPLIEVDATLHMLDMKDGAGAMSDANTFRLLRSQLEEAFISNLKQTEDPDHVTYIGNDYSYNGIY